MGNVSDETSSETDYEDEQQNHEDEEQDDVTIKVLILTLPTTKTFGGVLPPPLLT